MDIQEFKTKITQKLIRYIEKIELETGRKMKFEYIDDFGSPGTQFAFRKDPEYLCIAAKTGILLDDPRIERSIAHEITHCLLIYGRGYYALDPKENSSDEDILHLGLLSFIDDIVVNKIIQENGFAPYSNTYLEMLKQEIMAARYRRNIYAQSYSRLYNARYPISRYILAWAGIKYYRLESEASKLLNEFLKVFPIGFPYPYKEADALRKTIVKNDVFGVEGHKKIIQYILREWNLENKCSFRPYVHK